MRRQIPLPMAIAVIIAVIVLIVGVWAWRQRAARSYEEKVRQEVEQQLYQEKELGHPPGQPPVTR
ncbi:MAG: hypothetical protein NZ805_12555 [Armatimonadetes bacterium]|nr:hypothetical protein [Armatimonadota bacterium]MDW8029549.1 hypothetical protein [Armatimonadota bacterium]